MNEAVTPGVNDTILVPCDGSPESERALEIAVPLAQALGCRLLLAWVWEEIPGLAEVVDQALLSQIEGREIRERESYLERLASDRCVRAGVETETVVPVGQPAEELVALAGEEQVRYINMATHGRSGFKRWRLGSVADRVIRTTPITAVLLKPDPEVTLQPTIARILVALDGSAQAQHALAEAAALAQACGAALTLLRAVTVIVPSTPMGMDTAYEQANQAAVAGAQAALDAERAARPGLEVEATVYSGDAASAIIAAAEHADLVVMGSHGRGGVKRFLLGSVSDAVIRGSNRPVMVVRTPEPSPPGGEASPPGGAP